MPRILVDADACPVKEEVYRVARRLGVAVVVVANSRMQVPLAAAIELVVVASGQLDDVDDWIALRAGPDDIVVSADIRLAARCLAGGAQVLGPEPAAEETIGGEANGDNDSAPTLTTHSRRGARASKSPGATREATREA